PDAKLPKLRKACTITIGRPIQVERYRKRAEDRLVLRQIIDEVMFEIREMTGQTYKDVYAGKAGKPDNVVPIPDPSLSEMVLETSAAVGD
ncbi:MAG TPA: hypothetical protein VF855_07785, partial [Acidimicrobiales bacterium]